MIADGFTLGARTAAEERPSIRLVSLTDIGYHDARFLDSVGLSRIPPTWDAISMALTLRRAGLPVLSLPGSLSCRIRRRRDWWWDTGVDVDPADLYLAAAHVSNIDLDLPSGDWFAFGTLGHGMQSNFLQYFASIDGQFVTSRTPWGNAYGDSDTERERAVEWKNELNADRFPAK